MTRTILSYLPILLIGGVTASADPIVVLDFNNLQIGEEVLGYYNVGNGSLGTGPGPNLGITFTSDFVTVAQGVFGPPFQGEELTSTSGIMDVLPAFGGTGGTFSFYYSNTGADGTVNLYSGLDGSGSLVATIPLTAPPGFGAASPLAGLPLPFESAIFTGTAGALVFDNMTFSPPGIGPVTPEPSSISLLVIGCLLSGLLACRKLNASATATKYRTCRAAAASAALRKQHAHHSSIPLGLPAPSRSA